MTGRVKGSQVSNTKFRIANASGTEVRGRITIDPAGQVELIIDTSGEITGVPEIAALTSKLIVMFRATTEGGQP
jgi:hypothetical protein